MNTVIAAGSFQKFRGEFERRTGLAGLEYEEIPRSDGPLYVIKLANPTERFFRVLERLRQEFLDTGQEMIRVTLKKGKKADPLNGPEGRLLLRTIDESLNVNRKTFSDDFFSRYTRSVFGAEAQVTAASNHVVFGRRGAGKSSLLLFALHTREQERAASVWIDMQTYARRSDNRVIADIFRETLAQLSELVPTGSNMLMERLGRLASADADLNEQELRVLLPEIRRSLSAASGQRGGVALFLDDFHVLDQDFQPKLLGHLYAVCRGNDVHIKLSAIETLTKTWDGKANFGLQIGHDLQEIKLDYNLTMPEKATEHMTSILESHATYSGLPSIGSICVSKNVLSRLVWVAAGVPRDALSIFSKAMSKTGLSGGKAVSVSNVNTAASEAVTPKLKDLETDASGDAEQLESLFESIKTDCVVKNGINAFLFEIKTSDPKYQRLLKLVDLRLLHIISEGVSIGEAGRKYLGLILDFGFYVGIRASKQVELFNKQTKRATRSELRRLPVYTGASS